jgi:hypothetical protein
LIQGGLIDMDTGELALDQKTIEEIRKFNNRILYLHVKIMGYTGEDYNLSYADIYDFSNTKQSLKKFEFGLGIDHLELGLPWDQPVEVHDDSDHH